VGRTLRDHELRTLFDQKAQITGTLTQLDGQLHWLPRDHQQTEGELTHAVDQLGRDRERLQNAETYVDLHDRPLLRRGHETGISNAEKTVEVLPTRSVTGKPTSFVFKIS
jgi:hypothetical protein